MVSNIFLFSPLVGEMIQFDEHIFQIGWTHQLVSWRWRDFPEKSCILWAGLEDAGRHSVLEDLPQLDGLQRVFPHVYLKLNISKMIAPTFFIGTWVVVPNMFSLPRPREMIQFDWLIFFKWVESTNPNQMNPFFQMRCFLSNQPQKSTHSYTIHGTIVYLPTFIP